jgi:hypothetical protein
MLKVEPLMRSNSYELYDLSAAFFRAISEHANPKHMSQHGTKILFNGFWRNGDKKNVCAWLDRATWHDAKTGDGGGCKEFAKIAFGLELPDFLRRFGQQATTNNKMLRRDKPHKTIENGQVVSVENIWQGLVKNDVEQTDLASQWLSDIRGFSTPRQVIGSGFANLTKSSIGLFGSGHANFIKQRINIGPQLIVPIRGTHSEVAQNLFFRTIANVAKDDKSRLLPNAGGWYDSDGSPRAFGFPSLICEFPNLVICEGMADYFAAEYLLVGEEKCLPLGSPNASFLPKWADWLKRNTYQGRVIWIYQLDVDENNKIHASATGQHFAVQAAKILKEARIHSVLFNWHAFLKNIHNLHKIPNDLADVYSIARGDLDLLSYAFQTQVLA